MPTTLVTGGTGKTGRHIVTQLLADGFPVRVASRTPVGPAGADTVSFDWADPQTWGPTLEGVDRLYLVPPSMVADPSAEVTAFLDQATAAGVSRVVALSAMGVEHAPQDVGLGAVERAVRERTADWTILRPNWFAQNFAEEFWYPSITDTGKIPTSTGSAQISFVDVRDIAAVAVAALVQDSHDGQAYTITGPAALSFGAVAAHISEASGRAVAALDVDDEEMARVLVAQGLPEDYAGLLVGLLGVARAGGSDAVTDVVPTVTGRPAISFATYAADHADAWR